MACRKTGYRTTWKLRLLVAGLLFILTAGTRGWWAPLVGWGLVSDTGVGNPDLILLDNLDLDYQLFERAARLMQSGVGTAVLIPVFTSRQDSATPEEFSLEIVKAMCRVAHLESAQVIPITAIEPITLNAARAEIVADLQREVDEWRTNMIRQFMEKIEAHADDLRSLIEEQVK